MGFTDDVITVGGADLPKSKMYQLLSLFLYSWTTEFNNLMPILANILSDDSVSLNPSFPRALSHLIGQMGLYIVIGLLLTADVRNKMNHN